MKNLNFKLFFFSFLWLVFTNNHYCEAQLFKKSKKKNYKAYKKKNKKNKKKNKNSWKVVEPNAEYNKYKKSSYKKYNDKNPRAAKSYNDKNPRAKNSQKSSYKKGSETVYKSSADNICHKAQTYMRKKYRYGGESPSTGFDCSGLTQYVYKQYSYNLPRTAYQQSKVGKKIKTSKAKKGDLLFFGKGKRINHVGIVLSNDRNGLVMIHASSSQGVTETNIDNSSYWKKRLKKARKIIQ